jgi:hypothetical protein
VKTGDAKRTAIANSPAQYFPGVTEVIAVAPNDRRHVPEMPGLPIEHTERDQTFQAAGAIFLKLMR